ncbi:MAG: undecaprenyl-diphosphate phosphatase [Clostridia bacterium]|nr:undecaprenyl-diphosphate phosphatase [Clostridia bacterium]
MTILQAVILGITQGLTELLPISSSAHLNIIPWLLNWTKSAEFNAAFKGFDVALHFGTLLAIAIFFFKDWIKLIKGGWGQIRGKKTFEGKMFWYLVIATIPGGAIGFLLDHFLGDTLEKPLIIGIALLVMGILLYVVDKISEAKTQYEDMTLKQTFLIGLSQSLAFIPGVSRSGVTITTGRLLGVDRESCAKYTFLLSTPIVFAATLYKAKDFAFGELSFYLGVLASFVVGIFVIKFLMEYIKKGSFKIFAIYRVIVGALIIALSFIIK